MDCRCICIIHYRERTAASTIVPYGVVIAVGGLISRGYVVERALGSWVPGF